MLSKTRYELLLCFLLFGPVGVVSHAAQNASMAPVRQTASELGEQKKAADGAPLLSKSDAGLRSGGGQAAPVSPAGGSASPEKISRLLVDGRRAFHGGDYEQAKSRFEEALKLDAQNAEAKKYLGQIEKKQGNAALAPSGDAVLEKSPVTQQIPKADGGQVTMNSSVSFGGDKDSAKQTHSGKVEQFSSPVVVAGKPGEVKAKSSNLNGPAQDVAKLEVPAKPQEKIAQHSTGLTAPARAATLDANNAKQGAVANDTVGKLASATMPSGKSVNTVVAKGPEKKMDPVVAGNAELAKSAANIKNSAEAKAGMKEAGILSGLGDRTALNKAVTSVAKRPDQIASTGGPKLPLPNAVMPAKTDISEGDSDQVSKGKSVEKAKPAAGSEKKSGAATDAKTVAKDSDKGTNSKTGSADLKNSAKKAGDDSADHSAKNVSKDARANAAAKTGEGIKLFDDGHYQEALEKFEAALTIDPSYTEAAQYKGRSQKRVDDRLKKQEDLEQKVIAAAPPAKPDAQATDMAKDAAKVVAAKTDDTKVAPTELQPLSKALEDTKAAKEDGKPKKDKKSEKAEKSDKSVEATKAETVKPDPIVESDKLLREAQKDLSSGKKDDALKAAKRATEVDPNNVEARAFVDDLSSPKKAAPSKMVPLVAKKESAVNPAVAEASSQGGPKGVDSLITEGKNKYAAGQMREAQTSFQAALDLEPGNPIAKHYIAEIEQGKSDQVEVHKNISKAQGVEQSQGAFDKGLAAYQAGRLDVAVQWWNYALTLDPRQPRALQYLEQTKGEYDAYVQQHQDNAIKLQKETSANEKLDTPVTYDTAGQKSIVEFLSAMSLITDVSFYVADGVDPDIRVTAKFEDTPLHDALDIVMLPIGLKWARNADVISITPDLRTKFFNISPEQVTRLKTLLENKTVQKYLYGPDATPAMRNVELTVDDRENIVVMTDSQENISKMEAFLKDMQTANPPGLIYKSWKIRPEEGQKIKALVEAIVKVQSDAPYDLDRKVVVDNDDLIVKDAPDNIKKIEELLLDKNFIRKLETQKLGVATYNLTPREPITDNIEQVRDLAQNIVTVVKTILYSQSTESAANAEGRRFWYDPSTLQLTITDFPENLRVVGDYIRSLPMLGQKQKSEIVFLQHQTASELNDLLQRVLGLSSSTDTGQASATGASVTKTISVSSQAGELTFRDIRIRVTKINENDVADKNDDSVEMVVRTATTSQDETIVEGHSQFIEDYEINVVDARPSGTPGQGSAKIEVRYAPANGTGVANAAVTPVAVGAVPGTPGAVAGAAGTAAGAAAATENPNLQIEAVESMNALLIRYTDPGDLSEIKGWIEQLDQVVKQVNIETKLVEVNETKAKEFSTEFNVLNLGKGGPSWDNSSLDARFANDVDEFQSPFDPFAETPQNAGLLKGTTVLNFISGGASPINFTLRMLETEGVVNVVNGPHVLVENGQSASFTIEKRFGSLPAIQLSGTGTSTTNGTVQSLTQVQLDISPQITQVGEVRLDISNLQLQDFGNSQGSVATVDVNGNGVSENFEPTAIARSTALDYDVRNRTLQTVARVHNGGTIVLGGWNGEHSESADAGVPILRNIPYIGKLLFGRTFDRIEKTNLLIFLTCHIVEP